MSRPRTPNTATKRPAWISGEAHEALKAYCAAHGVTPLDYLSALILRDLAVAAEANPRPLPPPPAPSREEHERITGAAYTGWR